MARGGCYMMCNVCVRVKTISIKHDKRQLVWMLTDAGGTIQEGGKSEGTLTYPQCCLIPQLNECALKQVFSLFNSTIVKVNLIHYIYIF